VPAVLAQQRMAFYAAANLMEAFCAQHDDA
jgi:hypothetical protein